MSLGDPYITVGDLGDHLGVSDDGSFSRLVAAASRRVEDFTGRQFNKTETASARVFRAVDPERLPVDDFHTTDDLEITVGSTTLTSSQYDLRPWDGVVNGQTGWPFFDIFRVDGFWPYSRRAKISVTAQWGWAAVPDAIVQATLDVATVMSYGVGTAPSLRKSEQLGDHMVTLADPTLTATGVPVELAAAVPYRRKRFGVA